MVSPVGERFYIPNESMEVVVKGDCYTIRGFELGGKMNSQNYELLFGVGDNSHKRALFARALAAGIMKEDMRIIGYSCVPIKGDSCLARAREMLESYRTTMHMEDVGIVLWSEIEQK